MSVWGRILIQLPARPDGRDLDRWRRDLLIAFDPADFIPDGTLQEVPAQDMDLIPIDDGSGWIELGACSTYYDIGSEYADPTPFVQYAEWLEHHLPHARIYYGHDNSDDRIEPFDADRRAALMTYYARFGNEPYQQQRRLWAEQMSKPRVASSPPDGAVIASNESLSLPDAAAIASGEAFLTFSVTASIGIHFSTTPDARSIDGQAGADDRGPDQAGGSIASSSSSPSGS